MADAPGSGSTPATVGETTPLLASNDEPVQVESREQTDDHDSPSAADRTLPVVIATWVSLASGISCICFGTASAIIYSARPAGLSFPWAISEMITSVVFLVRLLFSPSSIVFTAT